MTSTPAGAIPRRAFAAPVPVVAGLEVLTLEALHARSQPGRLQRVHRADFHMLAVITAGAGRHDVDFTEYACAPGTVLHVRPGQVQRFDAAGRLAGHLVLFTADVPQPSPEVRRRVDDLRLGACWQSPLSSAPSRCDTVAATAQLLADIYELAADDVHGGRALDPARLEVLRHLLSVLLLSAPLAYKKGEVAGSDVLAMAFLAAVETRYAHTRRVRDYADELGYSERSLDRAARRAVGRSAKQVLDERVFLQARRLLAHTDLPVAVVGSRLGFSEATNFVKFFARHAHQTPTAFRNTWRMPGEVSSGVSGGVATQ